ncbi:MAG: DMT family transporter [Oscillospiraceae bacterium]|nr:DMT family transporter [Oscillospiraceae bacterium]
MKKQLRGSLSILLAVIIWGSTFVAQSVGMEHVGPFTFQAIRCGLGAVGLLPVIFLFDRKKSDGKDFLSRFGDKLLWKAAVCCAIPLFFAANLQQLGLVSTDAGKSAFLTAMYIVFVPLIGLVFHKKLSPTVPFAVVIAVIGLYFLSCYGVTSVNIGDIYLIGCAIAFAFQIIFVDKYANSVDPLRLNCLQAALCAVGSGIVMLLTETPTLTGIRESWWGMCYAGFLSMGAAYTLQILGQKNMEPTLASLIMSLESVVAVLCGALFLQELLTQWETIGCVLVFLAVILSQIPIKFRK